MFNSDKIDAIRGQSYAHPIRHIRFLAIIVNKGAFLGILFGIYGAVFLPFGAVQANVSDKQQKVLNQKLFLLNNMVTRGRTVKKIRDSGNAEAIELLKQAEDLYQLAKLAIEDGKHDEASHIINDAIRMVSSANSKAQGKKGSTPMERDRYQELLANIGSLQTSAEDDFTTNVDLDPVIKLKQEAQHLAKKDKFDKAIKKLNSAYQYIVTEMAGNVKNTTVVYSLDFKTSKDEYEYEYRRYKGNRELVERMLLEHEKNPTRMLVERYTEQADKTKKLALNHASDDNHDQALQVMERANKELKRSMGMLGLGF